MYSWLVEARDTTWQQRMEQKYKGKPQPSGQKVDKGTYTKQNPGEVAQELKEHSTDYKQATQKLNLYVNRTGRNLNKYGRKSTMDNAKKALKNAYGVHEEPKKAEPAKPAQSVASVGSGPQLKAQARIASVLASASTIKPRAPKVDVEIQAVTYGVYCSFLESLTKPANQVEALGLPGLLKGLYGEYKAILESIARSTHNDLGLVVQAFKERNIFKLLKAVGFNLRTLVKAFSALTHLVPLGLQKAVRELHKAGAFRHVEWTARQIDQVLDKFPILKKLSGPPLAALLTWIWIAGSFSGKIKADMDVSAIVKALKGNYSIYDLFASEDGLASLSMLATGLTGVAGGFSGMLNIGWLAQGIPNLLIALFYTGARRLKEHVDFTHLKDVMHLHPA